MVITLREIDAGNRAAIESLRITEAQQRFVESVADSLSEAESYEPRPWCRAIYAADTPIGFVMLADNDHTCPWPYYLWRFLIGQEFQGLGYGRAALAQVVEHVARRPNADALVTSVATYDDPQISRHSPLGFYLAFGFVDSGERHGPETVLRLSMRSHGSASVSG